MQYISEWKWVLTVHLSPSISLDSIKWFSSLRHENWHEKVFLGTNYKIIFYCILFIMLFSSLEIKFLSLFFNFLPLFQFFYVNGGIVIIFEVRIWNQELGVIRTHVQIIFGHTVWIFLGYSHFSHNKRWLLMKKSRAQHFFFLFRRYKQNMEL